MEKNIEWHTYTVNIQKKKKKQRHKREREREKKPHKNDGETRGALPKKRQKIIKHGKTCGYSLSTYNKCPSVRR